VNNRVFKSQKYMVFIPFPESTLKKLHKSKFSEFLGHPLILKPISKFTIKGEKLSKSSLFYNM
jgi:hypothetical protein